MTHGKSYFSSKLDVHRHHFLQCLKDSDAQFLMLLARLQHVLCVQYQPEQPRQIQWLITRKRVACTCLYNTVVKDFHSSVIHSCKAHTHFIVLSQTWAYTQHHGWQTTPISQPAIILHAVIPLLHYTVWQQVHKLWTTCQRLLCSSVKVKVIFVTKLNCNPDILPLRGNATQYRTNRS